MKKLLLFITVIANATMHRDAKIYVAGHNGLVGSALIRELKKQGYYNLIVRDSSELDLRDQTAVHTFFEKEKPDYVFLAAAKVGGILANKTYPAEFAYNNLMIECNVIHASYLHGVKKLLFLGSSCIYPRECPQPMKEEDLLTSQLEPTFKMLKGTYPTPDMLSSEMAKTYDIHHLDWMPNNIIVRGKHMQLIDTDDSNQEAKTVRTTIMLALMLLLAKETNTTNVRYLFELILFYCRIAIHPEAMTYRKLLLATKT